MKRILSILFLMIAFVKADAQDPHFTQVNRLASMVNPAVALGSHTDEERSEMRYAVRIAERESSDL